MRFIAPFAAITGGDPGVHVQWLCHCLRHPPSCGGLNPMAKRFSAFVAGLVFGLGLLASGMGNPEKVLAFLDLAGAWDPSLALVMVGAIAIGYLAFQLAGKRTQS